jgi:hypothetical protein
MQVRERSYSVSGSGGLVIANAVEQPVASDDAALTEAIAKDTGTSLEVVQEIYEKELSSLASEAKITQFLGVLATRRVRLLLRKH